MHPIYMNWGIDASWLTGHIYLEVDGGASEGDKTIYLEKQEKQSEIRKVERPKI